MLCVHTHAHTQFQKELDKRRFLDLEITLECVT